MEGVEGVEGVERWGGVEVWPWRVGPIAVKDSDGPDGSGHCLFPRQVRKASGVIAMVTAQ